MIGQSSSFLMYRMFSGTDTKYSANKYDRVII